MHSSKPSFWNTFIAASAIVAAAALLPACSKSDKPAAAPTELSVFAAASLTDVLAELAAPFEKTNDAKVVFNFAGSNTLAQQIIAAPRVDVFLSASEKWMDSVEQAGDLAPGTRSSVLSNSLAVIAHPNSSYAMSAPEQIAGLDFRFLSLGDPDAVPAGRYAKQWLSALKSGQGTIWDAVKGRISPAPDVRAALGQVEGSEDVIGIVYMTDYASATGRVRLIYALPAAEGPKISYASAVLLEAPHPELARAFLAYLSSPEAKAIFKKHGFTILN
ncbi:MAG: molybdate ABC transporter substrate-binding protein [Opitutales bacterium]|jgi:molybdate transport system substrate-binding protein